MQVFDALLSAGQARRGSGTTSKWGLQYECKFPCLSWWVVSKKERQQFSERRTVKGLAGERIHERRGVLPVHSNVLHSRLVGGVLIVCVVGDLERDGLFAACEQRHLMPRLHQLSRQVHANETRATCKQRTAYHLPTNTCKQYL